MDILTEFLDGFTDRQLAVLGVVGAIAVPVALWALDKAFGIVAGLSRVLRAMVSWGKRTMRPTPKRDPVLISVPPMQRRVLGREKELAELRKGLEGAGQAAIAAVVKGFGGYGKTTLARYYIDQYAQDYDGIFWGVAERDIDLAQALKALKPYVDVDIADLTPMVAAQALLSALPRDARWLFVYDNAPDLDTIRALMPQGQHLIVTTRARAGWEGFATVEPEVLAFDSEEAPAVRVLMEAAGRQSDAAGALDLAEVLGGLPLALVVAGALIRDTHEAFGAYRTRVAEVIAHAPQNSDYPDSVMGAVTLSYDRLGQDARVVLDVLAWWAPEGLSQDLFTGPPQGRERALDPELVSEEMVVLAGDAARLRAAFGALVGASLLTRDGATCALHRMTAAALRAHQAQRDDAAPAQAAVDLLAAVYPYNSDHSGNWPLCAGLTPHVRALWGSGVAPRVEATDYLLNQSAGYLRRIGDKAGDLQMATAALDAKAARLPEGHRNIAVGEANLGVALMQQGDFDGALQRVRRAVALTAALRAGSRDEAHFRDLLGAVLLAQHRAGKAGAKALEEAAEQHQRALLLFLRHEGRDSDAVAKALNNLAHVRALQGRGRWALWLARASLRVFQRVLPAGDARLGYALLNVGAQMLRRGQAAAALPLLQAAYDLWAQVHADRLQHEDVRDAAGWLIFALLVRARQGDAPDQRRAQAQVLCQKHGLAYAQLVTRAKQFPLDPVDDW